jgi:hypothetical protein
MSRVTCQGGVAPNGGLIVLASPMTVVHREQIVALAARHRLPAVTRTAISPPTAGYLFE